MRPKYWKIEGLEGLYPLKSDLYQDVEMWATGGAIARRHISNRKILYTSQDEDGAPIWRWDGEWVDDYIKLILED